MKTTEKKPNGSQKESEFSSKLKSLFESELRDIYWAEKALVTAIPKMIKQASSEELTEVLSDHLKETEEHVIRLERVFESIGESAKAKKCEAMAGLIKEAEEIMEECEEGVMRDAGIITAAQKVEHYEIATYGSLAAFAKTLGLNEALSLLEATLEDEKNADVKLTQVAEATINEEAASM